MKLTNLAKILMIPILAVVLTLNITSTYAASTISDSEKENYYAQYVTIAAEVSEETGHKVWVLPIDEFTDSDWVTTSKFREQAFAFANLQVKPVVNDGTISRSTGSDTNQTTITVGSITETLYIYGSFETQYNSSHDRQIFSGVNVISSYLSSSSNGTWKQIDYDNDLLDGGRTYYITVSGTYTRLGLATNLYASTYFYCSSTGGIS